MAALFLRATLFSVLLLTLLGLGGCGNLFFLPMKQWVRTPAQINLEYEDQFVQTDDGVRLHGWFLPTEGTPRGTILFLHGNAENISTHIASVYWLPKSGFNVFLLDYRGYGRSEGEPSLEGVQRDVDAALAMLARRDDTGPGRLVVLGQSIGGAIAIYAVANSPYRCHIGALVVESAFSAHRLITREKLGEFWLTWPFQYPLSWFISDDYAPIDVVGDIAPIPLLLMHGRDDPIVPFAHASRLYEKAQAPKQLWSFDNSGHIGAFNDMAVRERLVTYLTETLTAPELAAKQRCRVGLDSRMRVDGLR